MQHEQVWITCLIVVWHMHATYQHPIQIHPPRLYDSKDNRKRGGNPVDPENHRKPRIKISSLIADLRADARFMHLIDSYRLCIAYEH